MRAASVRSHEARLGAMFRRLMLAPLAASVGGAVSLGAVACQGDDYTSPVTDASAAPDSPAEAAPDASCTDAVSAPYYLDGSPDGYCYYFVDFSCPVYVPAAGASCHLSAEEVHERVHAGRGALHVSGVDHCSFTGDWMPGGGPPYTVACGMCPTTGRRPEGLRVARRARRGTPVLGDFFAQTSCLEAASVHAFERLALDLRARGAPDGLVRLARSSARDEVRHARVTAKLARRFGAEARPPRGLVSRSMTLEELVRQNAVEGCVRETFGALVALWQSTHAHDAGVRRAMAGIAADEARHAGSRGPSRSGRSLASTGPPAAASPRAASGHPAARAGGPPSVAGRPCARRGPSTGGSRASPAPGPSRASLDGTRGLKPSTQRATGGGGVSHSASHCWRAVSSGGTGMTSGPAPRLPP